MDNAIIDRNVAQVDTWATHAQRVHAIQQRDESYSLVEAREEARTRTMVIAGWLEMEYWHKI